MFEYSGRVGQGYFTLHTKESSYITKAVLEAPYHAFLKRRADANLARLIKKVAKLPWRKTERMVFIVNDRSLTKEQQEMIDQLPYEGFDYKAHECAKDPFCADVVRATNSESAYGQSLLQAIEAKLRPRLPFSGGSSDGRKA